MAAGDSIPDKLYLWRKAMKKVLVLALALLAVFAMAGCDSGTDDPGPGPGPDEGFQVPSDWVGFSDAEMLAGKFYIGYGGENPETTSVTKKGAGFEVKIRSVTNTGSRASVVWFNFAETVFTKGYYVSLTLPTEGGAIRPESVHAMTMAAKGGGINELSWAVSQNSNPGGTGDLEATFDDDYVVGDLSMHWGNEAAVTPWYGIGLWFVWAEDVAVVNNDKDYIFTINTIKVPPAEVSVEPQPEGLTRVHAYMQETVSWGGTWANEYDQQPVTNLTINYDSGPLAAPAVYDQFVIDLLFSASSVGKKYQFTVSDIKALDPSGANTITEADILAGFRAGNGDNGWAQEPNVVTLAGDAYSVTMTIIADGAGGLTRLIFPRASEAIVGSYGFKAVLSENFAD